MYCYLHWVIEHILKLLCLPKPIEYVRKGN